MLFVVLWPGTPEGSTGSGSGFEASRRRGNGLKSHPTDWEKPEIEPATPGLQDISLSPTPRRLLLLFVVVFFLFGSLPRVLKYASPLNFFLLDKCFFYSVFCFDLDCTKA